MEKILSHKTQVNKNTGENLKGYKLEPRNRNAPLRAGIRLSIYLKLQSSAVGTTGAGSLNGTLLKAISVSRLKKGLSVNTVFNSSKLVVKFECYY